MSSPQLIDDSEQHKNVEYITEAINEALKKGTYELCIYISNPTS